MSRSCIFLTLLLTACGHETPDGGGDDPPDGSRRIRVGLGTSDQKAANVYAFSVRVSRLKLAMSDGSEIVGKSTNIDVLRGGILLETYSDVTPRRVELEFDEPPDGSGVVPGARAAAYLSCAIQGEAVEYRGKELPRARLDASTTDIELRFALTNLFDDLTTDDFEDSPPHHVDEETNSDLAEEIGARLTAALGVCEACGD